MTGRNWHDEQGAIPFVVVGVVALGGVLGLAWAGHEWSQTLVYQAGGELTVWVLRGAFWALDLVALQASTAPTSTDWYTPVLEGPALPLYALAALVMVATLIAETIAGVLTGNTTRIVQAVIRAIIAGMLATIGAGLLLAIGGALSDLGRIALDASGAGVDAPLVPLQEVLMDTAEQRESGPELFIVFLAGLVIVFTSLAIYFTLAMRPVLLAAVIVFLPVAHALSVWTPMRRVELRTWGLALTVALLAGPPWLLTTYVGPPIPSSWPSLDDLRTIATVGVTDSFIITALAVIVWITWAQLALAVTTETLAAIRRRPSIRIPLLPGTQPLAARLVAATLLLVTVMQPRPVATAAPLDLVVATAPATIDADQPAAGQGSTVVSDTAVQTPPRTIQVAERDSWWSLAETHLDDGMRWRELRHLNVHRTQPDGATITAATDQLEPGWTRLVPASDTDSQAPPTADPPTEPVADVASVADQQWEVEQGDHFWHIAGTTLEQAWDRAPDDREIVPYWRELIDINRDRLVPPGDPDLIHPGQQFRLPPVPPDPNAPPTAEVHMPTEADADPAPTEPAPADPADVPDPPVQPADDATNPGELEADESASIDAWHRALLTAPPVTAAEVEVDAPLLTGRETTRLHATDGRCR